MKRGAIELSVGTLIVLILGTMILFGGIVLVYKIVSKGANLADSIGAQQRARIDQLLAQGQLVAVAPTTQSVEVEDTAVFGVGVLNRLDDNVTFNLLVTGEDSAGNDLEASGWSVTHFGNLPVDRNEHDIALVGVTPPENAQSGEYTFIVTVMENGTLYDSKRFFTVRVQ